MQVKGLECATFGAFQDLFHPFYKMRGAFCSLLCMKSERAREKARGRKRARGKEKKERRREKKKGLFPSSPGQTRKRYLEERESWS
jgi:hypothetical protein